MFFKRGLLKQGAYFWTGYQAGSHWYGAIAQLGERLHGMQEVSGSIPLGSTIFNRFAIEDAKGGRATAP